MIDTHAHLYLSKSPIPELLSRAKNAGLSHIVCPGLDLESSKQSIALSETYPMICPAIGVHPCEAPDFKINQEKWGLLFEKTRCPIGEIGLDYYRMYHPKALQEEVFTLQLDMASSLNVPVILHLRSAEEEMLTLLSQFKNVRKVFHCFSGSEEFVERVLDENTFFSVTATIANGLKKTQIEALKQIPLSKLMLETDSPYLTPKPQKGQENEPSFLIHIAEKLAEIKNQALNTILTETSQTARYFFNIH